MEKSEVLTNESVPSNGVLPEKARRNINAKLANPLSGYTHNELMVMGATYARDHGMPDLEEDFKKGALIAQDPAAFETLPLLSDADKDILRREITHKWSHPMSLYHLVVMCSMAACVQGMGKPCCKPRCSCLLTAPQTSPSSTVQTCISSTNSALATVHGLLVLSTRPPTCAVPPSAAGSPTR